MEKIQLHRFICLRCGHKWFPRKPTLSVTCPKCRSPYWDRPFGDKTPAEFEKQMDYARGKGGKQ